MGKGGKQNRAGQEAVVLESRFNLIPQGALGYQTEQGEGVGGSGLGHLR